MIKKKIYEWKNFVLVICALFFAGGCGDSNKAPSPEEDLKRIALTQKIALSKAAGELILVVGGEAINSDKIINSRIEIGAQYISPLEHLRPSAQTNSLERFKERARDTIQSALNARISNILLYQLAKEQAGEQFEDAVDKAAEAEMRKFILSYGGNEAKADEALKQMGMDRESFKERQKKLIFTQSYVTSKFPDRGPVTYRELMDYYNKMKDEYFAKPAMVQFRLIDIEVARLQLLDPNQSQAEQAKKLADYLIEQIQAGKDFGELAQAYSLGHMREFGGLWKPIQPQSLANPYDILADEIEKTEPGQVAGPIEKQGHIFIMKLEEKRSKSYEPFEKVQKLLEEKIMNDYRQDALDELNDRLMQQVAFGEQDEFIDFCLEKIYQISNQ